MIHLPPAHERRTHGRYASGKEAGYRWEKMIGQISGRGRSASPTASASTISVWCYKRSEEHTSELQSLMRISYDVFCLKKKKLTTNTPETDLKKRITNGNN